MLFSFSFCWLVPPLSFLIMLFAYLISPSLFFLISLRMNHIENCLSWKIEHLHHILMIRQKYNIGFISCFWENRNFRFLGTCKSDIILNQHKQNFILPENLYSIHHETKFNRNLFSSVGNKTCRQIKGNDLHFTPSLRELCVKNA